MTTARDIINSAFKKCGVLGVGQTLSAEDINEGFTELNRMLSQWTRKRYLCYTLVDTAFTSTGAQYFTVGPAGNYALDPRPDRIEAAYMVQIVQAPNLPVSYPLNLLQSYEDYAAIALKTLTSWPTDVFYDSDFPTGKLYVWPIPNAGQYAIHILTKANLAQFTNLSTDVNLPLEYQAALEWNLVLRLLAAYPRAQEDPTQAARIQGIARDALNTIRMANTQIPRLSLPSDLIRRGRYNVFSDRIY